MHVVSPMIHAEGCNHLERVVSEFTAIIEREKQFIEPLLSLLCFICTSSDEVSNVNGCQPSRPKPQKTKRGERFFTPPSPTTWDVGFRLGAALRKHASGEFADDARNTAGLGTPKRPHLRAAHWHHALAGRRKDEQGNPIPKELRKRTKRWEPPKLINCATPDSLVPTLHPVLK